LQLCTGWDLGLLTYQIIQMTKKSENSNTLLQPSLDIAGVRQRALKWWNGLTKGQQRDYEFKTYGYGDPFEDNTLIEADYIHMYKRWILHVA